MHRDFALVSNDFGLKSDDGEACRAGSVFDVRGTVGVAAARPEVPAVAGKARRMCFLDRGEHEPAGCETTEAGAEQRVERAEVAEDIGRKDQRVGGTVLVEGIEQIGLLERVVQVAFHGFRQHAR